MKKLILLLIISLVPVNLNAGVFFDGSNDYVRCGTTNMPTAYPMSMYARIDGTSFNDASAHGAIVSISDFSASDNLAMLGLQQDTAGVFLSRFIVRSAGSFNTADGTVDIDGDENVVLIGVANSATSRDVWTNGSDKQSNTTSTSFPTNLDRQTIGVFARNSAYATDLLNGDVREVAVWDVALTDDEISFLSNTDIRYAPLQVRPNSLTMYAVFDTYSGGTDLGTSNLTFIDLSTNGLTCTANGGSSIVAIDENKLSYP